MNDAGNQGTWKGRGPAERITSMELAAPKMVVLLLDILFELEMDELACISRPDLFRRIVGVLGDAGLDVMHGGFHANKLKELKMSVIDKMTDFDADEIRGLLHEWLENGRDAMKNGLVFYDETGKTRDELLSHPWTRDFIDLMRRTDKMLERMKP